MRRTSPDKDRPNDYVFRCDGGDVGLAVRSRLILTTVRTAITGVLHHFLRTTAFFNRDDLDTYRDCSLTFLAADKFGEIYLFDHVSAFDRYLSN